jgi:uncharacterized Zn ribbon protein
MTKTVFSLAVTLLLIGSVATVKGQTSYFAAANGDWNVAGTWNPGTGPPGPLDSAFIGSTTGGALGNATVGLTADQTAATVGLGVNVGTTGTLNLNGNTLFATNLFIGQFGGVGIINNGGGHFDVTNLNVANLNTFTFDSLDRSANLTISSGGTVTTSDTLNVSTSVLMFGQGSTLNLGANLVLSGDLEFRGTGANVATVNANGFDITARDIFIGRFNAAGDLLNDGAITATRDLFVSRGTFSLDADDSVADTVGATDAGMLTLHANTSALNGQVFSGGTLNQVATNNFTNSAAIINEGSTLNLGADLTLTNDLEVRGTGANLATVNANGFDITARDIFIGRFNAAGDIVGADVITATRSLFVSRGTFTLDANDSVADTVGAADAGMLTLHANTSALNGQVFSGGTLNQVATNNFTNSAAIINEGSTLNLGADLTLTNDLEVRGTGANLATVNANGFDITARDIFIGRFNAAGDIVGADVITATRNLSVSRGTFTLDANDSVADTVGAADAGMLTLHANTSALNGQAISGGTLNQVATNNFTNSAVIRDEGSMLNLGADLTLTNDLEVRGTGANLATVNANGFDITARDIFIGRFNAAGDIVGADVITATRSLFVSRGSFTLDANDSVADTVGAADAGMLTLHANTSALNGEVISGGTLNQVATNNFTNSAAIRDEGSTLNLGADLTLTNDLEVRGTGANLATVNANGFDITARDIFIGRFNSAGDITNDNAITATRSLFVNRGSFTLDANDSVANTVGAGDMGTLNLHANTSAMNAQVVSGGTLNQVATNNFTASALVANENSLLNANADVTLTGNMEVRGTTNGGFGTLDLNGNDLTANQLFVGRFGAEGRILDDGAIQVDDLFIEISSLNLTGGNDVIGDMLGLVDGSTLTVSQASNELTGLTFNGNSLAINDTSVINLVFDNGSSFGLDWAFRWANPGSGDRVAAINNLITNGQINITSSVAISVFDNGDGYTYVGYNSIPEPGTAGLLAILAAGCLYRRRRKV